MIRLTRACMALCLLFSLFAVSASPVAAVNPDACTSSSGNSFGWTWERRTNVVGVAFRGVRGAVVARALEPCTGGYSSGLRGKSFALVTFEGQIGGYNAVYHLGLMKTNQVDQTYFGWTNSSGSNTTVSRATWVDFDGDGTADNPSAGVTYTFRIYRHLQTSGPPPYTVYDVGFCVDSSDPGEGTVCKFVAYQGGYTGSGSWTGVAWWGCEAGPNSTSNVGSGDGATYRLYQQNAAYLRATDNAWVYTQNSPFSTNVPPWVTPPSNQHMLNDDGGYLGGDRMWCWGT